MLFSVEQAFVRREEIRAPLKTPAWEASEQATPGGSGGGAGKGRRARNYVSEIWTSASKKSIRNADQRRWHKWRRHYPGHVFCNVCLHSRSFPLRTDWRKSDSSVEKEPQANWRRNSNSRDVNASSSSRPGELPRRQAEWENAGWPDR